ncbi:Brefeldin A-sensitivity protein 4 [Akanthomyces lecanii RCEF 1005]|uniref:Brefeldin A-sensitivity protein 4 n=1 Tax=Akanthomyces lecanii RCEF 1005 TaxID=1081108 RepID=A0A168EVU5_CORDF|nr:Brefeldin A-sensitivity protein 4 [Akanthomyces lecanii RCEF 1005]
MIGQSSSCQDDNNERHAGHGLASTPTSPLSPVIPSSSDEHDSSRESPSVSPIERKRPGFRGGTPGLGSRTSSTTSILKLNHLLPRLEDHGADTYGVREVRDGFFDAVFLKAPRLPSQDGLEALKATLPAAFDKHNPLTVKHFLPNQWRELKIVVRCVFSTQTGIKLLKAFVAYFVAYVLCLVPVVRHWLGHQHYIMAVSVIINHPARTVGAQLDGVVFTILGTAFGIAWGAVALLLSTSTLAASAGYGGILALFLVMFVSSIAWVRAFFVRFYQAVLTAGIAIIYTTLSETHRTTIPWPKLRGFAVASLLGQAITFAVNVLICPDAGSRPLAMTLHQSLQLMEEALESPHTRDPRLRRQLSKSFVDLSEAYRDMAIDSTISRFRPEDVLELRNLMQAVLRALLSMDTETTLFAKPHNNTGNGEKNQQECNSGQNGHAEDLMETLATPTMALVVSMRESLARCDAALLDISGHRKSIGPSADISSDTSTLKIRLVQSIADFDKVESSLLQSGSLPDSAVHDSETVQLFVFARHVREAAATVQRLLDHVGEMQTVPSRPRVRLPSYPLSKAVYRTNAQIRHDRGGVVAGSYEVTFGDIARLLDKIKSRVHNPTARADDDEPDSRLKPETSNTTGTQTVNVDGKPKTKTKVRYRVWRGLYRLQGYESKYALKACIVVSLLAVPSYLDQSKWWWDRYEAWWAVAMSWVVMHPRVGGNLQDLLNRSCLAVLGAVWAGAGYAAGGGNPYVMAIFAAVYMVPMLYRYTLSAHPRSGLVGSLSFTVVSLGLLDDFRETSPAIFTACKGLVFFVGTAAPILANWLLWPFVARHELRAALSSFLFFLSVTYRSGLATYVYFEAGGAPTAHDVQRSELLEGRLREGLVRIRQLLVLTRHELRLRAPFDPLPWAALAEACERFLEHLIAVRQSALFYNTGTIRDSPAAAERLLPHRRDAVATVLANLYILAGALRAHRKVPRYLPSAAAARKALLVQSDKVEAELMAQQHDDDGGGGALREAHTHRKWSDIYRFSYNQSLTGCIVQLEEMEKYTKLIVGEQGFDDQFSI